MAPVSRDVDVFRPMYRIIRRINLDTDVRTALEAVTQGVVEAVGFRVAAISWLTHDLDFEVVSVAGNDDAREHLLGTKVPLADMEAELLVSDAWGSLLFIPAGRLDPGAGGWVSPQTEVDTRPEHWEPEDTLRCPLRGPDGELLGLLSVDLPVDGLRPDLARRELLEMYGDLAGLALNNASRAQALEERVALGSAVQTALVSIAEQVDLARMVPAVATPVAEAVGATALWLRVFDPQDETRPGTVARAFDAPVVAAPAGVLAHAVRDARRLWQAGEISLASIRNDAWMATAATSFDQTERVEVAEGRAGWVRRRANVPTLLDGDQAEILTHLRPAGVRHLMMCPIGAGADCLGYLVAARAEDPSWSAEQLEAAGRIARHLGQAVLTSRLLERERVLVQQFEALDRYKNDLISTVSHELRTPLTSIFGHLELIRDETPSLQDETARHFDVIRRNLDRVMSLADQLLTLKRLSSSSDSGRAVIDLHQVALDVVAECRPRAEAGGVILRVLPQSGPALINGNREELERVVLNLVDNAVKYTPAGGQVDVSTEPSLRIVRLTVRDTGIGISLHDQEELFSEFFRSTNPDALVKPGTGLGLNIVRRIVQRHGGSIRLESELGEGSTFTVRLPLSHVPFE